MERQFRTPHGDRFLRLASGLLREARDSEGLAKAVTTYIEAADVEAVAGGEFQIACRPGCPHCCVLNVSVLLSEAATIAVRLSEERSAEESASIVSRLDTHHRRVRWMENGERVRLRIGCPFLDARGDCTIHPYRPMACRGLTSLDPESCKAALDPFDPDAPGFIPMDMHRKIVMEDAYLAMAGAMAGRGMETRCIELSAGVWTFLTAPHLCGLLLAGGRFPSSAWE